MIHDFIPIYYWFELLSLLICLVMIRRLRGSSLFYLLYILLLVVIFESLGLYLKYIESRQTGKFYNVLTILQFPLWIQIFKDFSESKQRKNLISLLIAIFLFFSIINLLFVQGFNRFNNYSLIFGSFLIIFFSCTFLYKMLRLVDKNPLSVPMFWISCGSLLYFTGTFLYFSLYGYLRKFQIENHSQIFDLLILNLIIVFYACISVGLLVLKKDK
jgi:hypothetical protein